MVATTKAWRRARTLLPTVGLLAGLVGVGALTACDDDEDITNVVPPATGVAVFKDSNFNFQTLRTFAMPDTVVHFDPVTGTPLPVTREFDQAALAQVRQNLIARGYTQVSNPGSVRPDFVVLVGATATTNYNAFVGYSWYGTWGFYPGWGWYAPGFNSTWTIVYPWYGVVGVTAYDRGTMIVDMIPTVTVNPTAKSVRSVWAGVASGVLNGSITSATVTAAIDQMFALSPYLVPGPTAVQQ